MYSKAPANLATPTDISNNKCREIAKALNPIIADTFALYVKTKNFHWHVSGSHFRDYHLLFDEQALQIFNMVDVLAERVRKLGQTTLRSIGEIKKLQSIHDDEDFLQPKDMLHVLLNDNKKFLDNLRKAHNICSNYEDFATTSLLENYIDETERRIWFLFESVS